MGEAYTARHHVGRIQDAETEAPLAETIRPTLEQISAAIEALRKQLATQHAHGTTTVNDTVAQLQALLAQHLINMSVSAPRDLGASDSLRASLISAQSEDAGRITMAFAQAGENTGVRMTIAAEASYPTSAPWPDILNDKPPAQWGSQTIRRTNSSPFEPFTLVRFPRVFNRTPSVTCWLTGFESTEPPLRARVRTSQVSRTGFIIHIQPPTLLSVGISWLAGLPSNQIGEFDAQGSGMWADTMPLATGYQGTTGKRTYTRLAIGITQVDIGGAPKLPVMLIPQLVHGCDYFEWSIDAGSGDMGLYLLKGVFMMS